MENKMEDLAATSVPSPFEVSGLVDLTNHNKPM